MKIQSLHIEGFGHFADQPFGPFPQPLTVVLGHNEAGKSTLLAFIRTILFGFPAQKRGDFYPALKGGRHGGRVTLLGDDGLSYTVERLEDARAVSLKITSSTGLQTADEGLLRSLLGNSSRKVFEAVFALGLLELQELKRLNESDASAQIYAAGMGAANLPKALKSIKEAREKLFLKGGTIPVSAKLLTRLKDVEDDLDRVRGNASRYATLTRRLAELEGDAANARVAAVSRRLGELGRLRQAWNEWTALNEAETLLRDLPAQPDFPEDAVLRLNQVEDAVAAAEQAQREAAKQYAIAEERASARVPNELLLAQRDRIAEIMRERGAFEHSVEALPRRKADLVNLERGLAETLIDLGPDWTEARVTSFDTSIPLRDAVEQWRQQLEAVDLAARNAAQARERAEEAARDAADTEERLRLAFEAIPRPSADALACEAARVALSLSRVGLAEYQRASDRRANAEASASQAVPAAAALPPTRQPSLPAIVLAASGIVVAAGGAVLGGNAVIFGVALGLVLLGMAAAMFMINRRAPRAAAAGAPATAGSGAYLDGLRAEERAALAALLSAAQPIAPGVPTAADLENVGLALDRTERSLHELATAQKQWQETRDEHQRLDARSDAAARAAEDAERKLAAARGAWAEWLTARGLAPTLLPATVVALFARIDTARAKIQAIREPRERPLKIEADIRRYGELVQPLAIEYGLGFDAERRSTVLAAAERLIADFDAASKAATRREHSREALEEARLALDRLATRTATSHAERASLLALGNAADAEEFRRKAAIHGQRTAAEAKHRDAESRIRLISGPGEAYVAFRAALETTIPASLEEEHVLVAAEHEEAEHERDLLREERVRITVEIERLAGDEQASQLRAEKAVLEEQLRDTARRWAMLTVARTLLEKAQRKYEEERQPGVLRSAQEFFVTVTGGRYERLISPLGSQTFTAIAPDGSRKSTAQPPQPGQQAQASQLSRGTEDQLYLALRFGLIREFGARATHLPVIVDDILVNFDPERQQRTAAAFAELARTNQVLVFTCHPETVDLFRNASPAVHVIDLSEANNRLPAPPAGN
jgi:uncharacterized protein YhaN